MGYGGWEVSVESSPHLVMRMTVAVTYRASRCAMCYAAIFYFLIVCECLLSIRSAPGSVLDSGPPMMSKTRYFSQGPEGAWVGSQAAGCI